jgi:anaphase-promoting complex subunit 3
MDPKLAGRIHKSIKYRDIETALFLLSSVPLNESKYRIILPILLYSNGEYSRALFHLHGLNTCTSRYYEALCHKKRKDYKRAIRSMEFVIGKTAQKDPAIDQRLQDLLVDPEDTEYFNSLMGDLYTLSGCRSEAIKYYLASYSKSSLFSPVENLLLENKLPPEADKENLDQGEKRASPIRKYILDSVGFMEKPSRTLIKEYLEHVPGIGSYFVSNAARHYFKLGLNEESKCCFDMVRNKDPMFLHNIDYYSTTLWHYKDVTELGALCKNLIKSAPESAITWKALGNYYSHQNDYQRSVLCYKRSLVIAEDAYTYTLLGFESIQRNEYDTALKYFNFSLKMLSDNYRAMFGCGLVHMKTEKFENAEFFLRKAMEINPSNLQIKVIAMRFYTKRNSTDQSVRIFSEAFRIEHTDVHKLVEHIKTRGTKFSEAEEFLLMELVEILVLQNLTKLAYDLLDCVEYRGDSYCKKKDLLSEKME